MSARDNSTDYLCRSDVVDILLSRAREEMTRGSTNYGIFLANATAAYKAIAIRDTNAWIGSSAAGTIDVAGYLQVAGTQTKIGDITNGDYVQIEHTDGHLTLVGGATQWEDIPVEPVARDTGANVPTFERWANSTGLTHSDTTTRGVYLYSFDDAIAAAEKELFFTMQMPHSWASTAISLHVRVPFQHTDIRQYRAGFQHTPIR